MTGTPAKKTNVFSKMDTDHSSKPIGSVRSYSSFRSASAIPTKTETMFRA